MELLNRLAESQLSEFLVSDPYANPVLLCLHAVGMGVVVGVVWGLDLRVLGFPRSLPASTYRRLVRLAWLGFAVNAISGLLLFVAQPTRLMENFNFQLKLALIVLGGVSVWMLQRSIPAVEWENGQAVFSARAKLIAAVSALFWLGALVAGRYIAYTLAAPPR